MWMHGKAFEIMPKYVLLILLQLQKELQKEEIMNLSNLRLDFK